MELIKACLEDANTLAEIRASAMKDSLLALDRFDEERVKRRFLDGFEPNETFKVVEHKVIYGFYALQDKGDHLYLAHFYILPDYQNKKIGSLIISHIKDIANKCQLSIKLGALKGSKSNIFYLQHGFIKTHEEAFDNYYCYKP